jgi:acyl-CoA synthetase (AMP-forming)/AMP-acid ligase II
VLREVDGPALERNEVSPVTPGRVGRTLVSSGVAGDHDIRIVEPGTGEQLPDRRIGEIWVGGGSVALGYWEQPEETERTFRAMTAAGDGPFLRTGDLGFFENGELFVTGRIKELIIIHGRNLYPHDLERELRSVDPVFADRVACAFSVPVPQEEIVLVTELRPGRMSPEELAALAGRVRRGLSQTLDVRIANVVFVKVGQIARTTSGKIQRRLMGELFRTGELAAIYEDLDPATRARWRAGPVIPAERDAGRSREPADA